MWEDRAGCRLVSAAGINAAFGDKVRQIVLDLHGRQFIDSTGLHVILAAERKMAEHGKGFMVLRGPAPVQRVFEIARLAHKLPLLDIEA
jgi:anti-anti-sigma factor